ncbi:hypothetical protein, partial [uncultured Methanobrevibacter sp.]|uniref:hypothetical protein n=1 Tax=uncultured Methanobrevibacter sp. TaxID=253161 RepID=UPI00260B0EFD
VNTKNNILITQKNQRPLFSAIHPHLKKARYSCTFKINNYPLAISLSVHHIEEYFLLEIFLKCQFMNFKTI